ncbi:MAG: SRPBCC family protein [Candidatus Neomarinimicrobiota bacterium]
MFRLEYTIRIEESPQVVWAFLANLSVSLTCHRRRHRFHWIGTPKPGLDSRYSLELCLPGVTLRREGRVTRWEPPRSLVVAQWGLRRHQRGFTHQQRLSVQPVEGRPKTAVLQSVVVGSLGPRLVELAFKEIIRRSMLDHLDALKLAIESSDKSGRPQRDTAGQLAEVSIVGTG